MSANSVNGVLQFIRTLVAGHRAEGQPDQLLVEQFVSQRDETAFAALLERHGPMVLGVCRRMLGDVHLTEDAFQATFLVLARKAGELRKRESVASYLHQVAMNMARKVRLDASRSRRPAPPETSHPTPDAESQISWREQQGILDQELQRLPEKYRAPLLLCYLEGRTRDEAALQLGWTTGKLRGLLDRGREHLRSQLIRRGVTLSLAASATLMADAALSASVPPLLAVSTAKASLKFAGGCSLATCGVSSSVKALVEGALVVGTRKMLLAALVFLLVTGLIAFETGFWGRGGDNYNPVPGRENSSSGFPLNKQAEPAAEPDSGQPNDADLPNSITFTFTNNTKGKFGDDQVFWAILGNGSHYLNLDGEMVPMKTDDNSAPGHLTKNGVHYANYFHTLAEAKSIVVPKVSSGRLYLSLGTPMYFRVNAKGTGYEGANVAAAGNANYDVFFDFVEFNFDGSGFHGSTTQVDAFGFPLVLELHDNAGISKRAGIEESRSALFAAFKKDLPAEFASCVKEPYRILGPGRAVDFIRGKKHANYFDDYINKVWDKYSTPTKIEGGYTARVIDGALEFTHDKHKTQRLDRKPTSQEVFLGNGVLEKSPQFCAAINRHVLDQPSQWSQADSYYKEGPANYYAKFWHDHSINGKARGFCYDDYNAQDGLIEARRPTLLNITISW
jgi:RNA polymerase sigma factor (sigma-70 family)